MNVKKDVENPDIVVIGERKDMSAPDYLAPAPFLRKGRNLYVWDRLNSRYQWVFGGKSDNIQVLQAMYSIACEEKEEVK